MSLAPRAGAFDCEPVPEYAVATYLVTGGAGFIGSHLVDALVADGADVIVLDDLSTGYRENLPASVRLEVGSILDSDLLERLIAAVDGVFHLAAISSVQKCKEEWAASSAVNHIGAVGVFERLAKRGGAPVVYASSAAVYGAAGLPAAETDRPAPISSYGVDKWTNELNAGVAHRLFGLTSVGFRFFNVFGPRQDPKSPYSGVISKFVEAAVAGDPVTIFGDGLQTRDFIYVADIVRGLKLGMAHARGALGAHVFNLCGGREVSLIDLVKAVGAVWGRDIPIRFEAARTGDIRFSRGAPDLARTHLGFEARWTLDEGLAKVREALG